MNSAQANEPSLAARASLLRARFRHCRKVYNFQHFVNARARGDVHGVKNRGPERIFFLHFFFGMSGCAKIGD